MHFPHWTVYIAWLAAVLSGGLQTGEKTVETGEIDCISEADCLSRSVCLNCSKSLDCTYGSETEMVCHYKDSCKIPQQSFKRRFVCRFCFQTPEWEHTCAPVTNCSITAAQRQVKTICTVNPGVICLGNQKFYKLVPCNWASGYRWSTAFLLSVTLGGFGADRFYLGLWREGLGKVFSFGGLGVWTIVDVILVGTGYIGPADGSVYM